MQFPNAVSIARTLLGTSFVYAYALAAAGELSLGARAASVARTIRSTRRPPMRIAALVTLSALIAPNVQGYCNSATPDGTGKRWGPRTSSEFPPGASPVRPAGS